VSEHTRYQRTLKAVGESPWAILPEVLATIVEILALRKEGRKLSEEEIRERIGVVRAQPKPQDRGGVAVLPLQGVIIPRASMFSEVSGATSLEKWVGTFREALQDEKVSSIVLDVDSPGGMASMVPEVASEIRTARGSKPIVAVANTMAASAAYWIASQADRLVVSPSAQVGSIGVFAAHDDISKMQEQLGVKTTLVSAGKFKTEGNPFEPLSEEARGAMQKTVDEIYRMFVGAVAKGRGTTTKAVRSGFGEGRVVMARAAVEEGMADEVATIEEVVAGLQRGSSRTAARVRVTSEPTRPLAGAMPPHDTDVIDEPWDGPAEEAKIPNDAGAAVLKRMYAWQDPDGDPDTKAAYAEPHHQVVDGEPKAANAQGCRAGLQRLSSSRIPESDHAAVQRHLNNHLDKVRDEDDEDDDESQGRARAMDFMRAVPLEDISIQRGSDGRTVEAYASVFDVRARVTDFYRLASNPFDDEYGTYEEIIRGTAFSKSIRDRGKSFAVLFNHAQDLYGLPAERFAMPIGTPLEVKADAKGLWTVTRYAKTPLADEVLELIRDGAITAHSIGGRIHQSRLHRAERSGEVDLIERIEIALKEYGPCVFPAYQDARVVGVRAEVLAGQVSTLSPEEREHLITILRSTSIGAATGTPDTRPPAGPSTPPPAADTAPGRGSVELLRRQQEQRKRRFGQ